MTFDEKVVVITGGSGGLGTAITRAFLDSGATVVVPYTSSAHHPAADEKRFAKRLWMIKADLLDEPSVVSLFQDSVSRYGRLDFLVHLVGGFWMGGDIVETPLHQFEKMLALNLKTTFLCCREAFKLMKQQGGGKIFTVSARAALDLPAGMAAYATSKAAVLAFSEILAKEGAPHNVQANVLLPGTIDTPSNRSAMPDAEIDNWVKPSEFARIILALADEGISAVSGTAVKVYGKS